MGNETHYIEFTPNGGLHRSSNGADEWLDEERRRRLVDAVSELDGTDDHSHRCRIDDRTVRIVTLEGDDGARYLAAVKKGAQLDDSVAELLTERQLEVAEFAANGATVSEIGKALDISPNTVKHHIKNIYDRLGIGSRVELATRLDQ